jgi:hypothetical protein
MQGNWAQRAAMLACAALLAHGAAAQPVGGSEAENLHTEAKALVMRGDYEGGGRLLVRACDLGHLPACRYLGELASPAAFNGSVDAARTKTYAYSRACALGAGDGSGGGAGADCVEAGDTQTPIGLFAPHRSVQSWEGADAAYRKACDQHRNADGCARLGNLLASARNPGQDLPASEAYKARAASLKERSEDRRRWRIQPLEAAFRHVLREMRTISVPQ